MKNYAPREKDLAKNPPQPPPHKGTGSTHDEPSTVVLEPSTIDWTPGLPKEPGLYFLTYDDDIHEAAHPATVTVESRPDGLYIQSVEIDIGEATGVKLNSLGDRFKNPKFAPKEESTVDKPAPTDPNASETAKGDLSPAFGEGDPDTGPVPSEGKKADKNADGGEKEPLKVQGEPVKKTTSHEKSHKKK